MTHPESPSPFTAAEWHLAGLEQLEANRIEDAVRCLRQALGLDPGRAAAWNDLGVILEALGNPHDAACCYRRALAAEPGMEEARRNLMALAVQAHNSVRVPPLARNGFAVASAR